MKLKNLEIQNFRCFENLKLEFGERATVLIGKNGSGKSSLISALRRSLSVFFAQISEFPVGLSNLSNSKVQKFELWDARFSNIQRTFFYPVSIKAVASLRGNEINWTLEKESAKDSKYKPTLYKNAVTQLLGAFNQDLGSYPLPLFAFFADAYPHQASNLGVVAKETILKDALPRDFGYYGWGEHTSHVELWIMRLTKLANHLIFQKAELDRIQQQMEVEEKKAPQSPHLASLKTARNKLAHDERTTRFQQEWDFLQSKLIAFTSPLKADYDFVNDDFQIEHIRVSKPDVDSTESIEISFANGNSAFFETLPMGYKRLFSIVMDLAMRCFTLNQATETQGIVFIDEIELHLHPTLQQEVLQRFIKAFPNIQFICSTHSPIVLSNFLADGKDQKVLKLRQNRDEFTVSEVENVYGLDYTTNLLEVMGAAPRSSTIDKFINAHLFLYGKGKNEDADKMLTKLKEYIGTPTLPSPIQKEIETKRRAYDK